MNFFTKLKTQTKRSQSSKFTNPFDYFPDKLASMAVEQLQEYLRTQKDFEYDFGLVENSNLSGKMFGVLVVENKQGEIGYLAAFSGKLANKNTYDKFVPPIYDMLEQGDYFSLEMKSIDRVSGAINSIKKQSNYLSIQKNIKQEQENFRIEKNKNKQDVSVSKLEFQLKNKEWKSKIETLKKELKPYEEEINKLKKVRKNKSFSLQEWLFKQYKFLNIQGEVKNTIEIFENKYPVAASGECAAPKLLQYAFKKELKPLSMAEFWWGKTSNSQAKKHKEFYPACQEKCKPILKHMLKGITI